MPDDAALRTGEALAAVYRTIAETRMRDVPICNPALAVEPVGFRAFDGRALGVLITPWFMNLAVAGFEGRPLPCAAPGAKVELVFPAGVVELIAGDLDGFGRLDACSLFSPMFDFKSQGAAYATAEAVLAALFDPATLAPPLDRRAVLRGRFTEARP
jgi:[NiFe] hydrogenase assembly HybE family chaperone